MNTIDMRPKADAGEEEVKPIEAVEEDIQDEASVVETVPDQTVEEEDELIVAPSEETESVVEREEEAEEDKSAIAVNALKAEEEKLRKQISELRTERRAIREGKTEQPLTVEKVDLSDVAEADVALVEKILRAKGYVRKEELSAMTYKDQVESYKDAWLKDHPEYLPENDPNDTNWEALNTVVSNYFKSPDDPRDIQTILDLAHAKVKPEGAKIPVKTRASTDAAKEKIQVSSKGASSGGSTKAAVVQKAAAKIDRGFFQGFTDEELAEMGV